jgi:hypothetical protein
LARDSGWAGSGWVEHRGGRDLRDPGDATPSRRTGRRLGRRAGAGRGGWVVGGGTRVGARGAGPEGRSAAGAEDWSGREQRTGGGREQRAGQGCAGAVETRRRPSASLGYPPNRGSRHRRGPGRDAWPAAEVSAPRPGHPSGPSARPGHRWHLRAATRPPLASSRTAWATDGISVPRPGPLLASPATDPGQRSRLRLRRDR